MWDQWGFREFNRTGAYQTDVDLGVSRDIHGVLLYGGIWKMLLNPTAGTNVLVLDGKVSKNLAFGKKKDSITP